jgi:xylitol oxidase
MGGMTLTNWAGNRTYSAAAFAKPRSLDDVRRTVAAAARVRAAGARHSFSAVGDTIGTLVSTEHLAQVGEPAADGSVSVGAGISYGRLAEALAAQGRALPNFASLPHLSVGGAVATATHGSGARNPSLASAVHSLELVLADGSVRTLERGDPDFDGAVVSLGALGIVTSLTLETVPAFELCQVAFDHLPWDEAETGLGELLATGYSTSLFLSWAGRAVEQVWVKAAAPIGSLGGARAAPGPRHPVPGADPVNCTEQLGVVGPAHERLPHFRLSGVPSAGDELQSEYAVPAGDAGSAFAALRSVGPRIAPALHVSEIRAVAADAYWLSPFYERDAVTFHFTWKPGPAAVEAIAAVEDALRPWSPRPHWAKLFSYEPAFVRALYPRLGDFLELRARLDPDGKFRNTLVDALA